MLTTVEATIAEKLTKLWNLQQIDSQLDEIVALKGELPMEVSDLEDEIAGLETRCKKIRSIIKEIEGEIAEKQARIKEYESLLKKYRKQLDDVKNNREYEALTKEIEMAEVEIQLAEKHIRQARGKIDAQKEMLTATEARLAARQKDLELKKVELDAIIARTEEEERALRQKSENARRDIEERLLRAYDKMRSTYRNGLAVVTIERDACGGCFNAIPPQVQLEIGLHKKIIACEHCGRILVDRAIAYPENTITA
ncbi:MAG: C4-type zinc ribbon domain-containing protein [Saprospiraceae bacterium]|nr:C4-type zinc ribbon domain-containing protein [Saprospiraceae bacterium]MDW8482915.1 C4-type zinc ribbon domain-containing protein [Saprospiraceae bacterium]